MLNRVWKKFTTKPLLFWIALSACILGIFFRFYNLSWGAPYFFHPDERNIASAISQLSFPENLNPHFFAYGSLPIYKIYFTGVLFNFLHNALTGNNAEIIKVTFEQAVIIGRMFSLFLSLLLLGLIFLISKNLAGVKSGYIALIISSLSVGLIQYSHYATFEMWLTTLTVLLSYFILKFLETKKYYFLLLSALVSGALMSVKISSLFLLPIALLYLLIPALKEIVKTQMMGKRFILAEKLVLRMLIFAGIVLIVVQLTSPYFLLDNKSFLSSIRYETDVATGNIKVFYTQIFEGTIPVFYQLLKVYPFILNPFVMAVSIAAIIYGVAIALRKKDSRILLLVTFLFVMFFSQSFLFVKWIRYYIPTLPFLYILIGFFITNNGNLLPAFLRTGKNVFLAILTVTSLLYSFSYFMTVLVGKDTRVIAAEWANGKIERNAAITSEVYDLGIVPFNQYFDNIKLFNFYETENDPKINSELPSTIDESEYIIIPSMRILETRLTNPDKFPAGSVFYENLTNGNLGFEKIYETPCDAFCRILYLTFPITQFEQTANVFERPFLQIYKRTHE